MFAETWERKISERENAGFVCMNNDDAMRA